MVRDVCCSWRWDIRQGHTCSHSELSTVPGRGEHGGVRQWGQASEGVQPALWSFWGVCSGSAEAGRDDPSTEAGAPPGLSMTRQRLGRVGRDLLGGLLGPARSGSSTPNSRWEAVFYKSLFLHILLARCQLPFVPDSLQGGLLKE